MRRPISVLVVTFLGATVTAFGATGLSDPVLSLGIAAVMAAMITGGIYTAEWISRRRESRRPR
jgi:cell division protein FtsW (lipid II flippase)